MMIISSNELERPAAVIFIMRTLFMLFILATVAQAQALDKLDRHTALQNALQNNPTYLAAMQDSNSAKYSYWGSWAPFLPEADLSYSNSWDKQEGFDSSDSSSVGLSLGLNLFNGFRSYNSMLTSKLSMENSNYTEKETLLKTISDVNLAYCNALRTAYLMKSGQTLYESATIMLEEAEARQQLDFITRAELYSARADKEKAYYSLLDAQNNYFTAVLELSRLTGLEIDVETFLAEDERVFTLQEYDYYLQKVEDGNITLQKSYINREIAQRQYNSAYGGFLPSVNLSASTRWNYDDDDDFNSQSIGLSASWNLFAGMNDTFTVLANARSLSSAELMMAANRDSVMKNLRVSYQKAKISYERATSAELYLKAAEENYIAMQEMFRLGRASLKDTVDARATLEDAQASIADADYYMAEAFEELSVLTGTVNIN